VTTSVEIEPGVLPPLEDFLEPKTWIDLNPTLSVVNPERLNNLQLFDVDDANGKTLNNQLAREGYFHIPQLPWNLPLPAMAQGIARLTQLGLVPPFCFMYDEFWFMFFKLHRLLGRLLDDYAMLPEFWAWFVDPRAGDKGWSPHRDKDANSLFPDGRPKSLTVWLPLTEATTLNGCIYIVPAHLDPTYNTPQEKEWKFAYQDIRALPGPAGGLFVWTSEVMHWGSRSSPLAAGPRISLAFEFQRADVPPMNKPLIRPLTFLNFNQRLMMISKQILQYQHMYPLTPQLKALAEGLIKRLPPDRVA
jgi:phytanoyl-CoA dioxygenase PhyH